MKLLHPTTACALLFTMGSCATVNVNQIDSATATHYKKFAWAKPDIEGEASPLNNSNITDSNIKAAIQSEFAKKGVTEDDKNPDFLVMYHIFTAKKTETVANGPALVPGVGYGWGYGYGFGPLAYIFGGNSYPILYNGYYSPWNTGYHTEQYTDGTLIIDVIDAKTNELVWRGSIENPVNDPDGFGKQFSRESKEILAKYPDTKS